MRAYLQQMVAKAQAAAREWHEKDRFRTMTEGIRKTSKKKDLYRNARPGVASEQDIEIACGKCGNV